MFKGTVNCITINGIVTSTVSTVNGTVIVCNMHVTTHIIILATLGNAQALPAAQRLSQAVRKNSRQIQPPSLLLSIGIGSDYPQLLVCVERLVVYYYLLLD